jgi:hypothetical protein
MIESSIRNASTLRNEPIGNNIKTLIPINDLKTALKTQKAPNLNQMRKNVCNVQNMEAQNAQNIPTKHPKGPKNSQKKKSSEFHID